MSSLKSKISQTQYADLQRYIPEDGESKKTFEDTVGEKINNWEEAIEKMTNLALDGDADALFDLMELVYLNAFDRGKSGATFGSEAD